jgi:S1-C subfamily serine protease
MQGRVKRGYLGLAGQLVNLTERMTAANRLEKRTGVYISEVVADVPAYNSELHSGDIIVGFNDHHIGSIDDLHKQLNEKTIGRRITMQVLRGGHKTSITVIPGDNPPTP